MTYRELDRLAFRFLNAMDASDLDTLEEMWRLAYANDDVADMLAELVYRVACEDAGMDEIDEAEGLQ